MMIQDLSPPGLDHASLDETLRWLADFFKTRFGFSVAWRVTGTAELSRDRLRLVYRCIRELLMNARKHSQRQSAEVEVDVSPIWLKLRWSTKALDSIRACRAAIPAGGSASPSCGSACMRRGVPSLSMRSSVKVAA